MTAAILLITVGGIMVYSALEGVSIVDALKGVTGTKLDPKGGFQGDIGGGDIEGPPSTGPLDTGDLIGGLPAGHHGLKGPNAALLEQLAGVASQHFHLTITSVCRPKCSPNCGSYHEQCRAFDAAGKAMDMAAYAKWCAANHGAQLAELFYAPAGITIKNGKNLFPAVFDNPTMVHTAA